MTQTHQRLKASMGSFTFSRILRFLVNRLPTTSIWVLHQKPHWKTCCFASQTLEQARSMSADPSIVGRHLYQCPNCSTSIESNAEECQCCGALFGSGSTWKPEPVVPPRPPISSTNRFVAQVLLTLLLAYGAVMAFGFAIVFTALSLPIGLSNSPVGASVVLGVLYLLLAVAALVKCWRTSPFHPLVLTAAAPPALLQLVRVGWSFIG